MSYQPRYTDAETGNIRPAWGWLAVVTIVPFWGLVAAAWQMLRYHRPRRALWYLAPAAFWVLVGVVTGLVA